RITKHRRRRKSAGWRHLRKRFRDHLCELGNGMAPGLPSAADLSPIFNPLFSPGEGRSAPGYIHEVQRLSSFRPRTDPQTWVDLSRNHLIAQNTLLHFGWTVLLVPRTVVTRLRNYEPAHRYVPESHQPPPAA